MDEAGPFADLHVHTTASDGTSPLDERVEQARSRGLDIFAVTDHDCIPPTLTEPVTSFGDVTVLTGVEVRADVRGTKVEILGYCVDPEDALLQTVLERARENRIERNKQLVANLCSETDFSATYEDLSEEVDGQLGRPHLASALVEAGVVENIGAAFATYLGSDGTAFVPMDRVPHDEVIDALHHAGGVASLAHPGRIRADVETVHTLLADLADAGLDAIETEYPYEDSRSGAYADISVADARDMADQFDLLETGGSDCHGPGSAKFQFAECGVSRRVVGALLEQASKADELAGTLLH